MLAKEIIKIWPQKKLIIDILTVIYNYIFHAHKNKQWRRIKKARRITPS